MLERRIATDAWDDLRSAAGQRHWGAVARHARQIARRPARIRAVAGIVRWREAQRRHSAMVARDGGPTVGLLPGAAAQRAGNRPTVDLRGARWPTIVAALVRRPPGVVAGAPRRAAALARRLGSESL